MGERDDPRETKRLITTAFEDAIRQGTRETNVELWNLLLDDE